MAEVRIKDLAKELKRSNNEIIEYCVRRGATGITSETVLADVTAKSIRSYFAKAPAAKETSKESAKDSASQPKKKLHVIFHSENSSKPLVNKKKPAAETPAKAEPKAETVAAKVESKPESAPAAKPAAPVKAEAKTETAPVKAETKPEVKAASKPETTVKTEAPAKPEVKAEAPAAKAEPEDRKETPRRETTPQSAAPRRDGAQSGSYQGRTGEGQNFQRRDGAQGNGYQRRDGAQGTGYQRRDGAQGNGYQRRDGAQGNGYQRRDGAQGTGYQRRDGAQGTGYQRRDGAQGNGYQRRDGAQGTGFNRGGQGGTGTGFQNRTGQGGFNRGGQGAGRPGQGGGFNRGGQGAGRPGSRFGGAAELPVTKNDSRGGKNYNAKKEREEREKNKQNQEKTGRFAENGKNMTRYKNNQKKSSQETKVEEQIRTLVLPEMLTIGELAEKMHVSSGKLIKEQFLKGNMYTINTEISYDKAEEIALEYEIICEPEPKVDVIGELLKDVEDAPETLVPRPPVVCVMGHVDHGKTSLLDAIRSTNVTEKEAGGITQRIGAYTVRCKGQDITFLDTPGHEAFTAMRMRGALATDIAVLVVAADDGVMPQTIEAIHHAKAAGVDIIVAVNKIDKPGANLELVKKELSEHELIPEDWGGQTIFVPVSAKTHEGIDTLLEMILLDAEVKELRANPDRLARGIVIEAELDKGRGPVATILVQKGVLHVGDTVGVGPCYGKVRAMIDDKGRRIKEAGPSVPVAILGLNDVPAAGETLVATPTEKDARNFAETFISQDREKMLADTKNSFTLDSLNSQIHEGRLKELNLIIKADVMGSVEAVKQSLLKLSNDEVVVHVIHGGVGAINESDVTLASASKAIIIGFDVRPDPLAKMTADREKVEIRLYRVIYQAIADVEAAMKGMLDPIFAEKVIGHAVIRQLFKASGVGTIAGSYVTDGNFQRNCKIRITRNGEQIYEGNLASLKRFKDDVKEVREGYECGLVFEKFNDVMEEDIVEAYIMEEVPR